ncbi:MAG: phosphoserine phosphatase SerB [SAR116 cluster bacterium]|nr:phosphoserine phosphatase SerB [SAR116 cluster bacterium]
MHNINKILVVSTSIEKKLLEKKIIDKISKILKSRPNILWENVSAEFKLDPSFTNNDLNEIRFCFKNINIDMNLIKFRSQSNRKKKLLIADMDSTILRSETLDDLAILIGKIEQIKKITKDAMDGKINFISSLVERVRVLKNTNEKHLVKIKNNLKYNRGAKELITTMKKNGSICALCTGGFYYIANEVKSALGFDYIQANTLEIKNGYITGNLIKPIFNENSKKEFLIHLADKYKLSLEDTCSIGDGANDIEMNKLSSLGVSFKGKEILRDNSKYILDHSDLTGLLFLQGYSKSEIQ